MALTKRRYTTVDGKNDWIVTATWDEAKLGTGHWFEATLDAQNERTREKMKFPPELRTYRIGEIEHTFAQIVTLDYNGDREAAVEHLLQTIFRRVYSFIERGH